MSAKWCRGISSTYPAANPCHVGLWAGSAQDQGSSTNRWIQKWRKSCTASVRSELLSSSLPLKTSEFSNLNLCISNEVNLSMSSLQVLVFNPLNSNSYTELQGTLNNVIHDCGPLHMFSRTN